MPEKNYTIPIRCDYCKKEAEFHTGGIYSCGLHVSEMLKDASEKTQ